MNTTAKVALVTGTASGFGQATAALLAAQSFLVFGTTRAYSQWLRLLRVNVTMYPGCSNWQTWRYSIRTTERQSNRESCE